MPKAGAMPAQALPTITYKTHGKNEADEHAPRPPMPYKTLTLRALMYVRGALV